jgi:dipeptidyl aminopeptidase/acylaminoacyl peptidase
MIGRGVEMADLASGSEQQELPNRTTRRPLQPDDLFRIAVVGDVAISPDGAAICYVQTRLDRGSDAYLSDLWLVPSAGTPGEASRFTHGPRTVAQPRWSPDGRWLAFLADREEKGRKQLWIIPTGGFGGEARALTSGDSGISDFAWSPDSARLAFVRGEKYEVGNAGTLAPDDASAEGGRVTDDVVTVTRIRYKGDGVGFTNGRRSHLWTVDLNGAETRLTSGEYDHSAPAWSPDCRELVCVAKVGPGDAIDRTDGTDLWVIAADGTGEPRRLPTGDGPADVPAWSPDGQLIAFVGDTRANTAGGNEGLWIVAADGSGPPRNLTATLDLGMGLSVGTDVRAGLTTARPVWSPEGDALYTLASSRGDTPLWRVPLDGGGSTRVVEARGRQVQAFAFCAAGATLAINLADSLNPGDVHRANPRDPAATPRRLTDVNGAFLAEVTLAEQEAFEYAGAEGWPIEGWLVPPVGMQEGGRYPLVLSIHGGPHAAYGNMFLFDFQLLAARGYGVLFTNPRGSTNYGERFTLGSNDDWGGGDYRDVMLGVDAALARAPWIDPARLAVTGGSYGGYLTNWIVTQTDRFRAAITERSICNMTSKWGTSDIGYSGNDLQWGGPPWEAEAFYRERSPLTHIRDVRTPLLIIHSERDFRCLIEQGEQFFTALKYLGQTVEFVRFPNEGHELSRSGQPLHRLERLRRIVGWFATYL